MSETINFFDVDKNFRELAVEKINKELSEFKGDRYGEAVHTYVANALREFCQKSDRFAEVLFKTKRSLSDCISEIMKGCGKSISDIEVYRRAAKMYFPNSDVEFEMKITITGETPDEKYLDKAPRATPKDDKAKPELKPKKAEKPKKEEYETIQISLF